MTVILKHFSNISPAASVGTGFTSSFDITKLYDSVRVTDILCPGKRDLNPQ
jgi:hypothetical protein